MRFQMRTTKGRGVRAAQLVAATLTAFAAMVGTALAAPTVAVTQSAPDADGKVTLTVDGSGFAADPLGIYVAFGRADAGFTDASAFQTAKWVHTGATPSSGQDVMNGDGTFSTAITVTRTFTEGGGRATDCSIDACAVLTMKAHGTPDRTQDTATPVPLPFVDVTPTSDLDPAGETLHVTGRGFDGTRNGGFGFYVTFGPRTGSYFSSASIYQKAIQVTPTPTTSTMVQLQPDGTFELDLANMKARYTTGGASPAPVDCTDAASPCQVITFAARGGTDRGFDTFTPVTFGAAAPAPGGPGPSDPAPTGTPALSAFPTTGLSSAGPSTVTVSGRGYAPNEPGIYVAYGPAAGSANAGAYGTAKWVHPGATPSATQDALSTTGSFSTTLTLDPVYTDGSGNRVDCTVTACFIQTFAAHGSADRTQDRAVAVSFAGAAAADGPAPAEPPAPPVPAGAPSANGADATTATAPLALAKVRLTEAGRVSFAVSGPSTVTIDVRKRTVTRTRSGKRVVRWTKVKTIRVRTDEAGTVTRALGLRASGRYRVAISARGRDGTVTRAKPRTMTVKSKR
jgi:hypothetical protein